MYSDNRNDYYYGGGAGGQGGYGGGEGQYYYNQNQQGGYYPGPGQQGGYGNYAPPQQQAQGGPPPGAANYYQPNNAGLGNLDPMITTFAKQYGETLMGQGIEKVDAYTKKYVSLSKLKYYFAVDTAYVMKKMGLLFFPFTHKDWSIRFDKNEDDAVQPRNEVNAPDLYIPLMAFITFVLVAGVSLGMQQKFSPEILGVQASTALGWLILELLVCTGFTYVIQTDLRVLDLLAYCSYKFVGMIFVLVACAALSKTGYYSALAYFSLSLSVFLIRTLKVQIYSVTSHEHVTSGNKRRLYFLLALTGVQPLFIWWLTYSLTVVIFLLFAMIAVLPAFPHTPQIIPRMEGKLLDGDRVHSEILVSVLDDKHVSETARLADLLSGDTNAYFPVTFHSTIPKMNPKIQINAPNVRHEGTTRTATVRYETTKVIRGNNGSCEIQPAFAEMEITTETKVPKTGFMLVGWGGNNGTTITGMMLANKHGLSWNTKRGLRQPDYLGSVAMSSTFSIGADASTGEEVFAPVRDIAPILNPDDIELDGWDISSLNLADSMARAEVFDYELQQKLKPYMEKMQPRKALFVQDFVAANQADRANNILDGSKQEQLEQLRADIRDFKTKKNLEKIIVMWVGNTERFSEVVPGLNDTWKNLDEAIRANASEVSPSTLYAIASILEDCAFINGSPQNALVPGVMELAEAKSVPVVGDDLKTGQTKLKSVLVDYIVGAGLRPDSIVSYNHLGNNDGKNLSAPQTFRSKEISKRGVVEDMVASNKAVYDSGVQGPDHLVVIKYVPHVGDSKRAMDEYISSIAMGGSNTLVIHNTCEDSLLAAPIMLDLFIFMELFQRIQLKINGEAVSLPMGAVLGYWLKAPTSGHTNALSRQRSYLENLIRASVGLPSNNHLLLPVPHGDNKGKFASPATAPVIKTAPEANGHGEKGVTLPA